MKSDNLEYCDLLYFGYDFGDESIENKKLEDEFKEEISLKFPDVVLKDAYDSIKGYRQEVYLEKNQHDNYYPWLFAFGWFDFSLTTQLMMMSSELEQKEKFDRYFNLAKEQYPENFKK